MVQVAFQPLFLRAYAELGVQSDIVVQDSSAFTAPGEELSYFELQVRFMQAGGAAAITHSYWHCRQPGLPSHNAYQ